MTQDLNIAIAGLGTVGVGIIKILQEKKQVFNNRTGRNIVVKAVASRNKDKDRGVDLSNVDWVDNTVNLAFRDGIDVVVEAIGGEDGVAYELCKSALEQGKNVVTANKAMIAKHGLELAEIAQSNNVVLAFEAAVAGGIPILKALKEGLGANEFSYITGILNGTCNYMTTAMEETGRDFGDILTEAQELGYAEADPSFDIDGIDAAHKLSIIAAIAYGAKINFDGVYIEGIRNIGLADINYADQLGYKIKLLAICKETSEGVEQRVHPCLIKKEYPLASVNGVFNAVLAQCDQAGKSMYEGRGAGERPTASSVIADILDIATNRASLPFNVPVEKLVAKKSVSIDSVVSSFYVRLHVKEEAGVLAQITTILSDEQISIASLIQKPQEDSTNIECVIITHDAPASAMNKALGNIKALDTVCNEPNVIRIEDL